MSQEHVCAFDPMPMAVGRYRCVCGEQRVRDLVSGLLVRTKTRIAVRVELTVAHPSYWINLEPTDPRRVDERFFRSHEPARRFMIRYLHRRRI